MESVYKGYGSGYKGRGNKAKSAVKLQVVLDYLHQTLDRLDLTQGIKSDQGYRNHREIRLTKALVEFKNKNF